MQKVDKNRDLTVSIDWLEITLLQVPLERVIIDFMHLDPAEFTDLGKGRFGYRNQQKWNDGHVYVMYNSQNGEDDMGVHIMLSGQGCRAYNNHHDLNKLIMYAVVMQEKANFSRIDLAIDDLDERLIKYNLLHEAAIARHFTSRWSKWDELNSRKCVTGEFLGRTIYFGSQTSDIFCRIYDKTLERKVKGEDGEPIPDHWTRLEVIYKKERARKLAELIIDQEMPIGSALRGTLNQYIRFLKPGTDTNKSRWKTAPWWDKFLAGVDKLQLTQPTKTKSIEEMTDWVDKQIGPTIAAILKAKEGEMDWLIKIIHKGTGRLSQRHQDAISRYLAQNFES